MSLVRKNWINFYRGWLRLPHYKPVENSQLGGEITLLGVTPFPTMDPFFTKVGIFYPTLCNEACILDIIRVQLAAWWFHWSNGQVKPILDIPEQFVCNLNAREICEPIRRIHIVQLYFCALFLLNEQKRKSPIFSMLDAVALLKLSRDVQSRVQLKW